MVGRCEPLYIYETPATALSELLRLTPYLCGIAGPAVTLGPLFPSRSAAFASISAPTAYHTCLRRLESHLSNATEKLLLEG